MHTKWEILRSFSPVFDWMTSQRGQEGGFVHHGRKERGLFYETGLDVVIQSSM